MNKKAGVILLALALMAIRVQAIPILFGSNYYEFVQVPDPFTGTNNSWELVSANAEASVYNGLNGHLATITSQAENDFLLSLVSGSFSDVAGAWLGGKSPEGWLKGPEAGQAFTYTNWGGVEPNNNGYAYMLIGSSYAGVNPGEWGDDSFVQGIPDPNHDRVIGYFVEYEAIPEPASIGLLGLFTGGLYFIRRFFIV